MSGKSRRLHSVRCARWKSLTAISLLSFAWAFPSVAMEEILTNFAALRALTVEEAAKGLPVRIEGTLVEFQPRSKANFFMHDDTAGCAIHTIKGGMTEELVPGDRVLLEGLSESRGYYPTVKDARVKFIAKGSLPMPVKPDVEQLFSPELDSEWVEVPAVVTGYMLVDEVLTLDVEVYGLALKAELPMTAGIEKQADTVLQRPVRLRGVMATLFNRHRQMTGRYFHVASFDSIIPIRLPTNGEASPLLNIKQLLTGAFGPTVQVRVQGIITQQDPLGFYLRDASGSTLVYATRAQSYSPGMRVEVEGVGGMAPFCPVLRAARVVKQEHDLPPDPVAYDFEKANQPMMHDELVRLEADFLGQRASLDESILQCRAQQHIFEALLPGGSQLPKLAVGDRLLLTGICELTTTHALKRPEWADGFRLHLPGGQGVKIIARAPWWTPQRLLGLMFVGMILLAAVLLWTWELRRQLARKTNQLAVEMQARRDAAIEFQATQRERTRLAANLHDTLLQSVTALNYQLEACETESLPRSERKVNYLAAARRIVQHAQQDLRGTVWALRVLPLDDRPFTEALRALASQLAEGHTAKIVITEQNPLPSISVFVAGNLLLVAQEAMHNALKHARPSRIETTVSARTGGHIAIEIHDDGIGFDQEALRRTKAGHFGLEGMRERVERLGGTLWIESRPGQGTKVRAEVSLGAFDDEIA